MAITVVTKDNFITLLPSILHHIKECDFISFDTELTGLTSSSQSKYFYFDEPNDRYRKLQDSAASFGLLQFGLSAFKYKPSGSRYTSSSWSFHLFPTVSTGGTDYRRWMIQLSSISFLRENGFDFNKTFLQGIPFLSQQEEAELRARQTLVRDKERADIAMREDDVVFVGEMSELVRRWLTAAESDKEAGEALVLPPCNAYQRRLLYENLPKEFGEDLLIKKYSHKNGDISLSVTKMGGEARRRVEEEEMANFEKNITEQIGFRRVLDMIIREGKPIVGHNCWLDLCHTWNKFVGTLPPTWSAFKEDFSRIFKGIRLCDTKFIANSFLKRELLKAVPGTSLSDLATSVDSAETWGIRINVDGGKTKNASFHDAGFDAHCTGKVFVGLATLLARESKCSIPEAVKGLFDEESEYSGRLFMMQSDYDQIGIRLTSGEQKLPDRTNVFVLTDLTMDMMPSHLETALIDNAGMTKEGLQFYRVDNRSMCFTVAPDQANRLEQVESLKVTVNSNESAVRLLPFDTWKSIQGDLGPSPKRSRN